MLLVSTDAGFVAIELESKKDFDALPEATQARFLRIMDMWIERHALTQEQFNGNEGRAQAGELNTMLQAFKAFKVRLYGATLEIDGTRGFIIVSVDPAKKQNKADPKILRKAKAKILEHEKLVRKRRTNNASKIDAKREKGRK